MGRTWAIIERELRRFRRSPVLIAMSMTMPIVQLVILGYAFGGNVKHLKVAIVDQDNFVSSALAATLGSMLVTYNAPVRGPRIPAATSLDVVEVYPYVPYVQYLL